MERLKLYIRIDVLSESFLHLPLRPIFRQLHPNFIDVRSTYASEIWAQLTKNLLAKSSTKRFREYMIGIREVVMKIEHIALYVNNLEEARKFFIKYLGAKSNDGYHNLKTNFRSYFLSFDDGTRLEIMNKPEMSDPPKDLARTGYAHIAFSVGSKEKVDALTVRLKDNGYEVVSGPRITGDGYYESCIVAIEGNQIEITV